MPYGAVWLGGVTCADRQRTSDALAHQLTYWRALLGDYLHSQAPLVDLPAEPHMRLVEPSSSTPRRNERVKNVLPADSDHRLGCVQIDIQVRPPQCDQTFRATFYGGYVVRHGSAGEDREAHFGVHFDDVVLPIRSDNQSGSLVITATSRHIDSVPWRPAVIVGDLPQPLTGAAAAEAVQSWNGARACTDVTAAPTASVATPTTETSPVPPATAAPLAVDS